MNYKHKASGAVVSENDFLNLDTRKRDQYDEVHEAPTHTIGYRDEYEEDSKGVPVMTEIGKAPEKKIVKRAR